MIYTFIVLLAVSFSLAAYAVALAAVENARGRIVRMLIHAAQGQDALAEDEERDGDATHAAMRRQNAWAFRKAAEMIRTGRW